MSILETGIQGDLTQGDLLQGLTLYETSVEDDPYLCDPQPSYALVLSRKCKALRAEKIIVAPVTPYPRFIESIQKHLISQSSSSSPSAESLKRLLCTLRGDDENIGRFYLGNVPDNDRQQRFVINLEHLYTIQLPREAAERAAWIAGRRVARISQEHLRQLHLRFMSSIASEGYDDHTWWPQEDLELLDTQIKQDTARLQQDLLRLQQDMESLSMDYARATDERARQSIARKIESIHAQIAKKEAELQVFERTWKPYQDQLRKLKGES